MYMRKHTRCFLILLFITIAILSTIGCAGRWSIRSVVEEPIPNGVFTKAELIADFEEVLDTIQSVHVDPFRAISRDSLMHMLTTRLDSNRDSYSVIDAYRIFAQLITLLMDGHTGILSPGVSDSVLMMPVIAERCGGSFIVKNDLSGSNMLQGVKLLAINGQPIESLITSIIRFVPGERPEFRYHVAANSIAEYLYTALGHSGPFNLTYERDGKLDSIWIAGMDGKEIGQRIRQTFRSKPYEFRVIDSLYLGVLTLRTMRFPKEFQKLLNGASMINQMNKVKTMVVDIRGNQGGTDKVFITLLSQITTTPYTFYDTMLVRVPSANKSLQIKTEIGSQYVIKGKKKFDGDIYFLVDEGTFSSAATLALIAKKYNIGKLVGRTPGSPCSRTGALRYFSTTNTKLHYFVSTRKIVNGGCPNNMLVPDIEVPISSCSPDSNDIFDFFIHYLTSSK